ncbi:MAG: FAD-dependent monooxygenase, partial [Oscillospiraceae bacterium]
MIIVSGVRIPLGENDESAVRAAREKLALAPSEIVSGKVRRVSYDSRHGSVSKVCSVLLELKSSGDEIKLCEKNGAVSAFDKKELKLTAGNNRLKSRPVVVGFGPSGMFAAYLLSEYGFRPIVIERGEQVENRVKSVEGFFRNASLNPESNVQFGEGGAG